MKSNEIIKEGPLDWAGRVAAGVGGAMTTGSDYSTAYQQKAQEQQLAKYVKDYYPNLNSTIVNLKAQGVTPADMSKRVQAWATKYFGVKAPPPPPGLNAQQAQAWLKQVIAMWLTRDAEGDDGDAQQPAQGSQQPAAPAQGAAGQAAAAASPATSTAQAQQPAAQQPAAQQPKVTDFDAKFGVPLTAAGVEKFQQLPQDQNVEKTKAARAAGYTFDNQTGIWSPPAGGTEQPAQGQPAAAQQPAADPAHSMFKDAAAFKAEWDKFVASSPNYKLIADPDLVSTLKDMWMRSGGLKAESKKNKGKRV